MSNDEKLHSLDDRTSQKDLTNEIFDRIVKNPHGDNKTTRSLYNDIKRGFEWD